MPAAERARATSPTELPMCLALSGLASFMLAMPEPPPSLAVPWWLSWWLALGASALTFGCVFSHRALLVGVTLGAGTSLAELLLSGHASASTTCCTIAVAIAGTLAGARFGRALGRISQLRTVPARR